ncbi:FAD-dependent oxidoreductase [Adlercreutzia sp. ZJ138]|uniref:FAD-dependent oxidoreductase n=1 Tax=Adlercreutzia sp. ZJ138 TaxID=2709405 RepID=UPI0013EE1994|nr:FAD-dependent oxidoreductase [Adlercreutzia sp. ZJ138]
MALGERDFDVIVVGAGCSGSVAAYTAAKLGKSVLVVERGESAGAKNMTGGRIYAHSLRDLFQEYEGDEFNLDEDNPFERKIIHERVTLLDRASAFTVDYSSDRLGEAGSDSFAVLATKLDQWLCDKAEAEGAELIFGIPVDELLKDESGSIIGIRAGEDEITSHVVIVSEGQNSLLTERYLGQKRPLVNEMAVGIKQVFSLPAEEIESRFLCHPGEGAAQLWVGDCTHGNVGGGFMYTNENTISIGLVATIKELSESDTTIYQCMEDFKKHPAVAPIIEGAKLVEHSGHMVSEGGANAVPQIVFDGALVTGDAAMLCLNLGYQVRGMDLAISSGRFAAEAACRAIDARDVSAAGLQGYRKALENSYVLKDMNTFKKWPQTMEHWYSLFTDYPKMVGEIFDSMFVVNGIPAQPLMKRIAPIVKKRGLFKLFGEVRKAVSVL